MAAYDRDDEPPLDPAQERLRQKLVRLLFVSGAIMAAGLIAVFSAIVYKLNGAGETDAAAGDRLSAKTIEATLALPEGARILSADLDGDRALVLVEEGDGARSLLLVDLASGRVRGRFAAGKN
jgi:hypothetical protein